MKTQSWQASLITSNQDESSLKPNSPCSNSKFKKESESELYTVQLQVTVRKTHSRQVSPTTSKTEDSDSAANSPARIKNKE